MKRPLMKWIVLYVAQAVSIMAAEYQPKKKVKKNARTRKRSVQ